MLLQLLVSIVLLGCSCNGAIQSTQWQTLLPARRITGDSTPNSFLEQTFDHTVLAAWEIFKLHFNRSFHPEEHEKRFEIFALNLIKIHIHNQKYRQGKVHYKMSVNEFTDKSPDELKRMRCFNTRGRRSKLGAKYEPVAVHVPTSMDWRDHGAVTPVKNQGNCGSCWAFSTTGSIEGQYFHATKNLLSFSEQQLVDCSSDFGNNGCNGGLMDNAFKYIKETHGLNTEEEYPYVSGNTTEANPSCRYNSSRPHVRVTGYTDLQQFDEEMLKNAVATKGPVSVAINAGLESFPRYHSGVYSDEDCSGDPESLDHGVLVVGYGEENGQPYWLIKNSWGPGWGEGGYVKILRNRNNMCGVATYASFPNVVPV